MNRLRGIRRTAKKTFSGKGLGINPFVTIVHVCVHEILRALASSLFVELIREQIPPPA